MRVSSCMASCCLWERSGDTATAHPPFLGPDADAVDELQVEVAAFGFGDGLLGLDLLVDRFLVEGLQRIGEGVEVEDIPVIGDRTAEGGEGAAELFRFGKRSGFRV